MTGNNINYQKELDKILEDERNRGKTLFLHSCCAPCSSYVLTYLRSFFRITVFYYNPNITDIDEYRLRVEEQKRLIVALNEQISGQEIPSAYPIKVIEGDYEPDTFLKAVKGLENEPEGAGRCRVCFGLRLLRTLEEALAAKADYFATTLTISPLKNARVINEIGEQLSKGKPIEWLPSDFKKKDGYKQSIELSKKYDLYRQNYCGCEFSKEK